MHLPRLIYSDLRLGSHSYAIPRDMIETIYNPDIAWTIHPRCYPKWFKTKIFYEAYPEGQGEVDKMSAALGLHTKVIYDP